MASRSLFRGDGSARRPILNRVGLNLGLDLTIHTLNGSRNFVRDERGFSVAKSLHGAGYHDKDLE